MVIWDFNGHPVELGWRGVEARLDFVCRTPVPDSLRRPGHAVDAHHASWFGERCVCCHAQMFATEGVAEFGALVQHVIFEWP